MATSLSQNTWNAFITQGSQARTQEQYTDWLTNVFGENLTYNDTDVLAQSKNVGMDISSLTLEQDVTTTTKKGFLSSSKSIDTQIYANEAQMKSYYEAFTTVEKTRKAQLQAFGKEQATLAGQTFASPTPVTSTASQSVLG